MQTMIVFLKSRAVLLMALLAVLGGGVTSSFVVSQQLCCNVNTC